MRATKLSFSLGREAEMILQIKGSTYEAQESSLCRFQFFLFCSSFYSEASLLGLEVAVTSLCLHLVLPLCKLTICGQIPSSYRYTSGLGPLLKTHFNLITFLKTILYRGG